MTQEQKELRQTQIANERLQKENSKIQRDLFIKKEKQDARCDALSKATFLDYGEGKKTAEAVKKEAEKLYQWLIKDLK